MNKYERKYREKTSNIRNNQKAILESFKLKKGYQVYSAEELDLPLIHNYESIVSSAEKKLKKEINFKQIFNAEVDEIRDGFSTSKRYQLNLNITKYDGLVDIFRGLVIKAIGNEYPLNRPVALWSNSGCPAQREHRDYQTRLEQLCFGVLWSPFMDTSLLLSEYSHNTTQALKVLLI